MYKYVYTSACLKQPIDVTKTSTLCRTIDSNNSNKQKFMDMLKFKLPQPYKLKNRRDDYLDDCVCLYTNVRVSECMDRWMNNIKMHIKVALVLS